MTAETEVQESPGAEFDVELSIAALKLRLFRDFYDVRLNRWRAEPNERPLTQAKLASILHDEQKDDDVVIDSSWIGDLFTNPYGIVGRKRASDRVVRIALRLCVPEELKHQRDTTYFLAAMEQLASAKYDSPVERLKTFKDHYRAVFDELLRFANVPPDEELDEKLAPQADGPGLSIDGAAMLAQYYNWLSHLENVAEVQSEETRTEITKLAIRTNSVLRRAVAKLTPPDTVPLPLIRLYLIQSLCNELSRRSELAIGNENELAKLKRFVQDVGFFSELDWILATCPWRYDEARIGLIVAATLSDSQTDEVVEKYALFVLNTLEKLMMKIHGEGGFDYSHPVFHLKEPVLRGYETLATIPQLKGYMNVHEKYRTAFAATKP
ncbi:hypothetical protein ACU8OR_29935 (plasmid) [Rhizobium leguminosarum]